MNTFCNVNNTLLCYHQTKFYQVRCTDIKKNENGNYLYKVHYLGWNKKWDEWVTHSRLKKFDTDSSDFHSIPYKQSILIYLIVIVLDYQDTDNKTILNMAGELRQK